MPRVTGRLVLLMGLLLTTSAKARAEWVLGAFGGGAATRQSPVRLVQPVLGTDVTLTPVAYDGENTVWPVYYGYRLAFFPRGRWVGLEAEMIHLKVVADTRRMSHADGMIGGRVVSGRIPVAEVIERLSITHGVNLVLVNAVARRDLGARSVASGPARASLVGRVGVGASVPHPESRIGGAFRAGYEFGSLSVQAAVGAELRVVGPLSLTAEYKITRTAQNVGVAAGRLHAVLVSHHAATGVAMRFGR